MKLKIKLLFVIMLALIVSVSFPVIVYSDGDESATLNDEIDEILESVDFSELEDYYSSIPDRLKSDGNFTDFLKKLASGQEFADYDTIFSYCISSFKDGIKEKLPLFLTLFSLLVICGIINATGSGYLSGGVTEIAKFAVYTSAICIVTAISYSLLEKGKTVIDSVTSAIEAIFPIILTLMTVTGSTASVAVYTPSVAFISDFAVIVVKNVIFPLIVFILVASVISNINKSIKLKSLIGFLSSGIKWIIGLIVTLFSVFLTVKGLSAGTFDGISFRAVKYTVNSSVPIVGGLIKDGLDFIIASAVLIKNSLGVFAIIFIFSAVIGPVLEIVIISLCLKFVNAVTEPIGDGRANEFINSVSTALNFMIASILLISLMCLALVIMVVYSSQVIL